VQAPNIPAKSVSDACWLPMHMCFVMCAMQELVDRHKQYRAERLRELKAAAWNAAARSSSSSSSSTECSAGTSSTSSNTSSGGSVLAAELSV